jgi:tetratricopeptide (TPR) repeat protein
VAHVVLSEIAIRNDLDVAAARHHMERALEFAPNSVAALIQAGNVASVEGEFEAGLRYSKRATELDPVFSVGYVYVGFFQSALRNHQAAIAAMDTALELRPSASGYHYYKAGEMILHGDYEGALAELEQETLAGFKHTGLAYLYHSLGEKEKSDTELDLLIELWADLGPYQIGSVYAWRGENDKAFEWLNKAIDLRDTGIGLIPADVFLDPIRDDPRFEELYKRTGFRSSK